MNGGVFMKKVIFLTVVCLAHEIPCRALNVAITAHELVPLDASSVARPAGEPVTFGVPLMDADGVTAGGQLGLAGASAYQFKVLNRYPSGNAQWVLVDAVLSGAVGAGGSAALTLANGGGNAGGSDLAADNGSIISVNTGPAQFVVRKTGFNGLDSVTVNGQALVASGHAGGVRLTLADGTVCSSADASVEGVSVAENGPAKALVRARGRFKTPGGSRDMGYTVDMTFSKGASWVKAVVILRNGYHDVHKRIAFRSAEWTLPLSLGTSKSFSLAAADGVRTGALASGQEAYIYQGFTKRHSAGDFWQWPNGYLDLPVVSRTGELGAKIVGPAGILKNFGSDDSGDYSLGWGELKDGTGRGVTVVYKDMEAYFPASLEFSGDGGMTVGLYSGRNSKTALVFDGSTRESRELLMDFHTAAVDNALVRARLQQPFFGRAPFEQYRASGSFLGETRLASYQEQQEIYAAHGRPAGADGVNFPDQFSIPNQSREVYRIWNSGQGGTDNQRDKMLANELNFVRIDDLRHGGALLNAFQRAQFMADQFPWYSDGYDAGSEGDFAFNFDLSAGSPVNGSGEMNKHEYDAEHMWTYGLFMAYFLTGDDRYRDAVLEMAESVFGPHNGASDANVFRRMGLSTLRIMALAQVLEADSAKKARYLAKLDRLTATFLRTPFPGNDDGRSFTNGFVVRSGQDYVEALISNTYIPAVLTDVLKQTSPDHAFTPDSSLRREDLEDALEGGSWFNMKEGYFYPSRPLSQAYVGNNSLAPDIPGAASFSGPDYHYFNGTTCVAHGKKNIYDSGMTAALGYELTGRQEFLDLGLRLAINVDIPYVQMELSSAEMGLLRLLYDIKHPLAAPPSLVPLNAVHNGGGNYTLSWTAPAGAQAYQVKYSAKNIVLNLDYDKTNCAYQYDPAQNDAFWAARNVAGEPAPAAPGTVQSMTLLGLACGTDCHFALRARAQDDPSSAPAPQRPRRLRAR
jgi:hypothetical protein